MGAAGSLRNYLRNPTKIVRVVAEAVANFIWFYPQASSFGVGSRVCFKGSSRRTQRITLVRLRASKGAGQNSCLNGSQIALKNVQVSHARTALSQKRGGSKLAVPCRSGSACESPHTEPGLWGRSLGLGLQRSQSGVARGADLRSRCRAPLGCSSLHARDRGSRGAAGAA